MVDARVNYKGEGPHGNKLYWTVIAPAAEVEELAVERAAELGVIEYSAPRDESPTNDWGWVFEPEKMQKKADAWRRKEKAA